MIAASSVCVSGGLVLMAMVVIVIVLLTGLAFIGVMYGRVQSTDHAVTPELPGMPSMSANVSEILKEQDRHGNRVEGRDSDADDVQEALADQNREILAEQGRLRDEAEENGD